MNLGTGNDLVPIMEDYAVKHQTPTTIRSRKQVNRLSASSRKKLDAILDKLSSGCTYQEVHGHRLFVGSSDPIWISIPLNIRERVILAMNKDGRRHLYFIGSHEDYNKLVGPKKRRRLANPFD